MFWIKAHAGLAGNERADELAKQAALKLRTRPHYDACPVSFVKRQIRTKTLDEWNRRYKMSDRASTTKIFFPDALIAYKVIKTIKTTGVLTQVMTGHGGFSEYLHRFGCKEDPSCICEPGVEETVQHVLLECPLYGLQRYETEMKLDITLNINNISEIIFNKDKRNIFINFCTNIAEKIIKRNK